MSFSFAFTLVRFMIAVLAVALAVALGTLATLAALTALAQASQSGCVLFFHFKVFGTFKSIRFLHMLIEGLPILQDLTILLEGLGVLGSLTKLLEKGRSRLNRILRVRHQRQDGNDGSSELHCKILAGKASHNIGEVKDRSSTRIL